MSRRKAQLPPEIPSTADLTSMDERATMREFTHMLGNLTTVLAMMSSHIDQFEQGKAKSVDITSVQPTAAVSSAQPVTGAGGNFTAATSQTASVSAQPETRAGGHHRC